jgi:hypothetical protein
VGPRDVGLQENDYRGMKISTRLEQALRSTLTTMADGADDGDQISCIQDSSMMWVIRNRQGGAMVLEMCLLDKQLTFHI